MKALLGTAVFFTIALVLALALAVAVTRHGPARVLRALEEDLATGASMEPEALRAYPDQRRVAASRAARDLAVALEEDRGPSPEQLKGLLRRLRSAYSDSRLTPDELDTLAASLEELRTAPPPGEPGR